MMKMATEIARKVREEKGQARDAEGDGVLDLELDLEATPRPLRVGVGSWAERRSVEQEGGKADVEVEVERSPPPAYEA